MQNKEHGDDIIRTCCGRVVCKPETCIETIRATIKDTLNTEILWNYAHLLQKRKRTKRI